MAAQRAKFREETPVTRQDEDKILFLAVDDPPAFRASPSKLTVLCGKITQLTR